MEEILLYILKLNILAAAVILLALAFSGFMKRRYSVRRYLRKQKGGEHFPRTRSPRGGPWLCNGLFGVLQP